MIKKDTKCDLLISPFFKSSSALQNFNSLYFGGLLVRLCTLYQYKGSLSVWCKLQYEVLVKLLIFVRYTVSNVYVHTNHVYLCTVYSENCLRKL